MQSAFPVADPDVFKRCPGKAMPRRAEGCKEYDRVISEYGKPSKTYVFSLLAFLSKCAQVIPLSCLFFHPLPIFHPSRIFLFCHFYPNVPKAFP